MRVAHCQTDHLLVLNDAEATSLAEASALIMLAVKSDARLSMPPVMGKVLCDLFEALSSPTPTSPGFRPDS